jgi:hypothetical protein
MERKIGDLVLVYVNESPSFYGRIENIEPDQKPGWYQVTFLFLGIPARMAVWILREEYIDGAPFTMGGTPLRLELVRPYKQMVLGADDENLESPEEGTEKEPSSPQDKGGKVIPLKPKK